MCGLNYLLFGLAVYSAQPRGDCLPPDTPSLIQREITNAPYIKAGAYAPLHGFALHANPPSDAGSLALISDKASAEPFRSVCRNLSGKLPSHPFAAHTCASRLRRGGCWLAALCLEVLQHPHCLSPLNQRCGDAQYIFIRQRHYFRAAADYCAFFDLYIQPVKYTEMSGIFAFGRRRLFEFYRIKSIC